MMPSVWPRHTTGEIKIHLEEFWNNVEFGLLSPDLAVVKY